MIISRDLNAQPQHILRYKPELSSYLKYLEMSCTRSFSCITSADQQSVNRNSPFAVHSGRLLQIRL